MAKALELQFITQLGKTARVSIDAPIEPVDTDQVKQVMDTLIATNVIQSSSGALVAAEGARVIERNVTEYEV
ncbi:DUF2922 domain-containing protein [Rossellomorea vietnamensis]|uniref:DUF2922 domain-containing protein n=1 Tax=Rossellomorea vietnamensis TaxID=218284 RepID=A0A5D4K9K6_9BACI|nr:DUF2922 domain-containing protein [Rossellomorea vietnamensis]TYR73435.1 DUF2922 domain-containing protein [Rossellomorea vietnamensis]